MITTILGVFYYLFFITRATTTNVIFQPTNLFLGFWVEQSFECRRHSVLT